MKAAGIGTRQFLLLRSVEKEFLNDGNSNVVENKGQEPFLNRLSVKNKIKCSKPVVVLWRSFQFCYGNLYHQYC